LRGVVGGRREVKGGRRFVNVDMKLNGEWVELEIGGLGVRIRIRSDFHFQS
jgi:hypothetical protein